MDRRSLLKGLGGAATSAAVAGAASGPAISRDLPDITVVGAGAFGAIARYTDAPGQHLREEKLILGIVINRILVAASQIEPATSSREPHDA
jgi:hypothetical protein